MPESSDQKRSILEDARNAAQALVEREAIRWGRMAAYEIVGQMVGASPIWVRRFVNKHPSAKPDLVIGWNILQQYARTQKPRE